MQQRSEEWFAARLGKVTASRINDVMARLKNGDEAATRRNYKTQLLVERLTGKPSESYTNQSMQWGIDNEEQARLTYGFMKGVDIEEVGFIDHPSIDMTGASPDGLVGTDGLIEIKCPNTSTHIEYIQNILVPSEYVNQMQWQLECTGRKWCDFVSYDPRLPVKLQLFIIRYEYDAPLSAHLISGVSEFLKELKELENNMLERMK